MKLKTAPCHAATIPVALIPNCAATRYVRVKLDGSGPAHIEAPTPELWDGIPDRFDVSDAVSVNLDGLDQAEVARWRCSQTLLLSGKVLAARDAAHKRLGPAAARPAADYGPARPRRLLRRPGGRGGRRGRGPGRADHGHTHGPVRGAAATAHGALAMVGKAERGPEAVASIARHGAAYLAATGGAAYLLSRAIRSARVVAFEDLGMEAIHEFELVDFR